MINTNEQAILGTINIFEGEIMQTQYSVLGYKIDLYFYDYKLLIEDDELGHSDRNIDYELQKATEEELDYKCIKINPDEHNYNIFKDINEIHICINN